MKTFDTVAKLKLAKLKEGQFVNTGGYFTKGGDGSAEYFIKTSAQATTDGDVIDGFGNHTLANGNVAIIQLVDGVADASQWGAIINADSTTSIQSLFDSGFDATISKPYLIDAVDPAHPTTKFLGGVKPSDNTTVTFIGDGKLTAITNDKGEYVVMNLKNTTGVKIVDGVVVGDLDTHTDTGGEFGMGYYMDNSRDFQLLRCKASKFWGDGFFVGDLSGGTPSTSGYIAHCIADDNRRQGLSIASWRQGLVIGGEYKNTGQTLFTAPGFGIDIEPDPKDHHIDVTLIGVRTSNNFRGGIQCVPGFLSNALGAGNPYRVTIIDMSSFRDGTSGGLRFAFPDLTSPDIDIGTKIHGEITVIRPEIKEPKQRGVDFARWIPTAPPVRIVDAAVYDCNTDGNVATIPNQSAYVVNLATGDVANQTSTGKIDFIRPRAYDSRSTPLMLLPIYLHAENSGQSVDNVLVEDPYAENQLSTTNGFVNWNRTLDGLIKYTKQPEKAFVANTTLVAAAFSGELITMTVSGVVTLPLAADSIGIEYYIHNPNGVTLQLRPNAADEILTYGNGAGVDAVFRKVGSYLKIKSIGNNKWQTFEMQGEVAPLNTSPTIGQNGIRTNAGTPVGSIVPRYIGEDLLDTTGNHFFKATGLTNADWKQTTV